MFMRTLFSSLLLACCCAAAMAATDVRVNFTLHTTDPYGEPLVQNRYYYVYRPDGLAKTAPVPMVLVFEYGAGASPGSAGFLHRKADQAGFVVVACAIPGNTLGGVWNNDDPRITGYEDMDYTDTVIDMVRQSDNCNDAFVCGLSKGGHMTEAYACVRPNMIRAAAPIDEFMGLSSNIPRGPVPMIVFQGTSDSNVPYTMVRDTVDAWRAYNGLLDATPVTTYECSPLSLGKVSQATWRGGRNGTQVAFVTIIGGGHNYAVPGSSTGYDCTDGMWAFFSQFLTPTLGAPVIVSQPVTNIQTSGQMASFWVVANGTAPFSYQWQRNGVNILDATNNWYTTPLLTLADSGANFRAIVGNSFGSVTSSPALLTVNAASAGPAIQAQPANQTVQAGQPVQFSVTATGTPPLSYQWRKNGVNITGATAASYTIPAAILPDSGASFTVRISNGSGATTSAAATLTVLAAPAAPIILSNVVRARVLTNQAALYSVASWSATPMSYQWQKGVFLGNMADIPGATNSTYTTPLTTTNDHLTLFRCVVANSAGNVVSGTEMLMVTTTVKAPTDIISPITAFGQVGVAFNYHILSSGGTTPITYGASPLPPGLFLDPATGLISGLPSVEGTNQVVMSASNSAGAMSRTLSLTLTTNPPALPLEDWRWGHFGVSATHPDVSGDLADPDGDGISNISEYALGSDPLSRSVRPGECAILSGFLTYTVSKDPRANEALWSAESSNDLNAWDQANTTVLEDSLSTFKVRDNFGVSTNSQRFLRINVTVR